MKAYYLSSSKFPSKRANSVHVMKMVNAITNYTNSEAVLFAATSSFSSFRNKKKIIKSYNASYNKISLVLAWHPLNRLIELIIFFRFILYYVFDKQKPNFIISRNLVASYFCKFFFKNFVYETHFPEKGFRLFIQKRIFKKRNFKIIVISYALKKYYIEKFKISEKLSKKILVCPDGADKLTFSQENSLYRFAKEHLKEIHNTYNKYNYLIGYFGHLYEGRGLNLINNLAIKNKNILFLIYGGTNKDIKNSQKKFLSKNLVFMGYYSNNLIPFLMRNMDILLMPYEKKVFLSKRKTNTAKFMSPMKLFEYMSTGVPLISSNLIVLKEILKDNHNCLLAEEQSVEEWNNSIIKLLKDKDLRYKLANNAKKELENKYTWLKRVENIIKFYEF